MSECVCVGCKNKYSSCRAYCNKYKFWLAVNGLPTKVSGKIVAQEKELDDYIIGKKVKRKDKYVAENARGRK